MRIPTIMNDFFKARYAERKEKERSALELSLVKAFYRADPEGLARKAAIAELKAISKEGAPLSQPEINKIPERRARLIEEFGSTRSARPPVSREAHIDREISELIGQMAKGIDGTAQRVVIDRIGTLCTERSYRMARPSFHTRQKYLDRALDPVI